MMDGLSCHAIGGMMFRAHVPSWQICTPEMQGRCEGCAPSCDQVANELRRTLGRISPQLSESKLVAKGK